MTEETSSQKNRWKVISIAIICTAVLIGTGYLMPEAWTGVLTALTGLL